MNNSLKMLAASSIMLLFVSCNGAEPEDEGPAIYPDGLSVVTAQLDLYRDCGCDTVSFSSSEDWEVSSDDSWITVDVKGKGSKSRLNKVVVHIADNNTTKERTGTVNIVSDNGFEVVLVNQSKVSSKSVTSFLRDLKADNRDSYRRVAFCAHRANTYSGTYGRADCPENSVSAILRCGELGIEMVEIDVRKTSDGALVCSHDDNLASTTVGSGYISKKTLKEVQSYDMKIRENGTVVPGVHIPTLADALKAARQAGVMVNLDLNKTTIPVSELYAAIVEAGMADMVTCYVGGSDNVDNARKIYNYNDNHVLSLHMSVNQASACASLSNTLTEPLFQISTSYYWDGTNASKKVSTAIHNVGYCTFSNMLDYDKYIRTWQTTNLEKGLAAVQAFIDARIDIMQTDVADGEVIRQILEEHNINVQ